VNDDFAPQLVWAVVCLAFIIFIVSSVFNKRRRGRGGLSAGPGASGAIYDLLNQDRRKAIELIVEEKAEARDPETADDVPRDAHH
jgi:hypothetical protein